MKKDIRVYLDDILESIKRIQVYIKGQTEQDFLEDLKLQDALIRRLAIIGEAVKKLPADLRDKHSNIPWRDIAGMRDKVIHDYSDIDLEAIWEIILKDLPTLKKSIRKVLKELGG